MTSLIFAFILASHSHAKGTVSTTGFTASEIKGELTPKEFASRLEVSGDLFVTSADGRRLLYKISESRTGKPGEDTTELRSNWGHTHKFGDKSYGIFLKYSFRIQPDGSVTALIQQFDSMKRQGVNGEVQYGKLVREEKFDPLLDFAPVNWVVHKDAQVRIVARLTPRLIEKGEALSPDTLPVALDQAVLLDGAGKLWADDLSEGGGKFVAIATHKGTLAVSYFPFAGAKEVGVAKGHQMSLPGFKPSLTLRNSKPFLAADGEIKVYGLLLPQRKTSGLNSIHMIVTDKESEFLEALK